MTKYNISGNEITISTEVENERCLMINTKPFIEKASQLFDDWYEKQYNCSNLINTCDAIWDSAATPLVERGIEMLNAQGIYSLDTQRFIDKYADKCVDKFFGAICDMKDEIGEVDYQNQQEHLYRQQRKENRGRVVGGGFGFGGAVKGMATAGVMNATTGMMHSLGNAVGNMGSSIAASSSKAAIFKSSKGPLKKAFIESIQTIVGSIREAIEKETGVKCKYVTASEFDTANAILNNYKQNRIPEEQKKIQLLKTLELNPYNLESYYLIWESYGDENGELRKMASYFGVELVGHLKKMAEEYGNDLYIKTCGAYESAWNKRMAAIPLETEIKGALDNMIQYCNKCDIPEDDIPAINQCKEILQLIDSDLKTVRGTTYNSREVAESIKEDYKIFYEALTDKNIFDDGMYEYIESIHYNTEEFIENLHVLFETEQKRRTPEKIYENFSDIIKENVNEACRNEWIDISGHMGSLSAKERMIYTITEMPIEEIVLILFDKSSNGKSGVLITNRFFRIYSKGIFSNENRAYPIEAVEEIQCLADDEYTLNIRGQGSAKFNLKHKKLSAEDQISIANAMSGLVTLVNNLNPESRRNLYRILKGVVRCKCGVNLLANEKLCPSCKRMLMESGDFIETQVCPGCNSYIPVNKKFCSQCGFKLIVTMNEEHIS